MSFFLYQIPTVPKIWHRMFCCVILSHASWMEISVSLAANNWFLLRKAFIWWKQISQVFKCGEYGGWKRRFTPYSPRRSLKALSVNLPWWNGQLSMITVSPLSRRTEPPRLVISTASSKKIKSSLPLEAPSSIFTKSTPRQECKRFIVKVALDADLWISKAGVPVIEFSYRLFIVVFVTLASSKKWIVLTTKSLTWSRKKFVRASISAVLHSDVTAWIFFFVISSSFPTNLVIVLGWGKSSGCRTPSNTSLFCNSEV